MIIEQRAAGSRVIIDDDDDKATVNNIELVGGVAGGHNRVCTLQEEH